MNLPEVGERVTVVAHGGWFDRGQRVAHGVVDMTLQQKNTMPGFSVLCPGGVKVNLWELDPAFVEGVGWCRGWDGPAVDALKVAEALT